MTSPPESPNAGPPLSDADEDKRVAAIDPDGVLRDLAFGIDADEAPSAVVLKRARFFLKREGALAYAYHLVDDAVTIALAAGASIEDAERYAESPLAQLIDAMIEDDFEEVPVDVLPLEPSPTSRPESLSTESNGAPAAANDDDESSPRAKILRLVTPIGLTLAAAAALLLFIRPPDDGPGVKGIVSPSMTASVVTVDGPLDEKAMVRGLATVADALGDCFQLDAPSASENVVEISLETSGDGKPSDIVVGGASAASGPCFEAALSRASFDFARKQTRAKMRITYVPPAQTP